MGIYMFHKQVLLFFFFSKMEFISFKNHLNQDREIIVYFYSSQIVFTPMVCLIVS